MEALRDPLSAERRDLDPRLARSARLSARGLEAALEAVLGGVRDEAARQLAAQLPPEVHRSGPPVLAVLAGNLPGLAVQPLLPALVAGRPVLLKSSSDEPHFAPAFVAALQAREPRLTAAVAAASWRGGDAAVETPLLAVARTVLAYGDDPAIDSLRRRAAGTVIGYGPKTSLAVIGRDVDPAAVASGLARDVALFDQRGCLSVAAVYTAGEAGRLAEAVAAALVQRAEDWPPGPVEPAAAAAVQQLRLGAELRGLTVVDLPLATGTVIVDPVAAFRPSPGLRTVRIHPLDELTRVATALAPWAGKLQGAALAGDDAWALAGELATLGVSRLVPPGELQSPDATWHNGGVHPLHVLLRRAPSS